MKQLGEIGELSAIEHLRNIISPHADSLDNLTDDCAVIRNGKDELTDLLLTSDPVIQDIHFSSDTNPEQIGHKAIGRVLSDIAAMGGTPAWALINVVAPPETPVTLLEEIYKGAVKLGSKYNFPIVGGDLANGPTLELHVFGVAHIATGKALMRLGAKPGDIIYVTGTLGGSLKEKHLSFEPRINEGRWLAKEEWPSSMIDLSDGLASDLRRIIKINETGSEVNKSQVPISEEAAKLNDDVSPLGHALSDGEDFELLFTIPKDKQKAFDLAWKDNFDLQCTAIGNITSNIGTMDLIDEEQKVIEFKKKGFEHFKQ